MAKFCTVVYGNFLSINAVVGALQKSVEGKVESRGNCLPCDVVYTSNDVLKVCPRCRGPLTGKGAPVG